MNDAKYIGLDVHQATFSVAILDSAGEVMEAILETKAETSLQFIRGLRGSLHVTLEKEPAPPGCRKKESERKPKKAQEKTSFR
jgi:hypothetical protein